LEKIIVVAGGNGLIGSAITKALSQINSLVVVLDKDFKNIPYLFISSVAQQGLTELKDKLWSMLND
jgi:nucleoside-diphosphate-sugar epimerase